MTEARFAEPLFMLDLFAAVGLLALLLAVVGVVSVTVEAVKLSKSHRLSTHSGVPVRSPQS